MWGSAKIASFFILTILSMAGGIFACVTVKCLVNKYKKSNKFARTISALNCFAGGVFFATCILDILPEGREKMEEAKEHWGLDTEYPLSELMVGVGFLLLLTMEHGVHTCFHVHSSTSSTMFEKTSRVSKVVPDETSALKPVSYINVNEKSKTSLSNGNIVSESEASPRYDEKHKAGIDVDSTQHQTCIYAHSFSAEIQPKKDVVIMVERSNNNEIKQDEVSAAPEIVTTALALKELEDNSDETQRTNIRGIVLLAALSFHMVFEGLALGLLQDTSKIWNLLLALSLHKALVFYTIGIQILEMLKSIPKTVFLVFVFSLISPVGIIIGESISSSAEAAQVSACAILQGLSAGVFIYVTFFEILQREFSKRGHDLCQVLVTIVGFALVSGLPLLEHDD